MSSAGNVGANTSSKTSKIDEAIAKARKSLAGESTFDQLLLGENQAFVVLCGWMDKQGQGGILHRRNWKRRFFVLYKVPSGCVLVYYDKQTVRSDAVLGFIDLRDAKSVKRGSRVIAGEERNALEIHTKVRTFVVAPETVTMYSTSDDEIGQYILGWPVPKITLQEEVPGLAGSTGAKQVFDSWNDAVDTCIQFETAVFTRPVNVTADGSNSLPDTVILRATASAVVLIDSKDRDLTLMCIPYTEISSYKCPIPSELSLKQIKHGEELRFNFVCEKAFEVKAAFEQRINKMIQVKKRRSTILSQRSTGKST